LLLPEVSLKKQESYQRFEKESLPLLNYQNQNQDEYHMPLDMTNKMEMLVPQQLCQQA